MDRGKQVVRHLTQGLRLGEAVQTPRRRGSTTRSCPPGCHTMVASKESSIISAWRRSASSERLRSVMSSKTVAKRAPSSATAVMLKLRCTAARSTSRTSRARRSRRPPAYSCEVGGLSGSVEVAGESTARARDFYPRLASNAGLTSSSAVVDGERTVVDQLVEDDPLGHALEQGAEAHLALPQGAAERDAPRAGLLDRREDRHQHVGAGGVLRGATEPADRGAGLTEPDRAQPEREHSQTPIEYQPRNLDPVLR